MSFPVHGKYATPAQAAIAWLLAQEPWIVPISGTTKWHRLVENLGPAGVQLRPQDLREIESVASKVTVHGARYPALSAAGRSGSDGVNTANKGAKKP